MCAATIGTGSDGQPVYLRDIWPSTEEVKAVIDECLQSQMFTDGYSKVFAGDDNWRGLDVDSGEIFEWHEDSTYVQRPPYFDGIQPEPQPISDITGARVLVMLGDSVTTDHISPAARSAATARPVSTCASMVSNRPTSIPTDPVAATTR